MAQPPRPAQPVLEASANQVASPPHCGQTALAGTATAHLPSPISAPPVLQAGATLTTAPTLPDPVMQQPPDAPDAFAPPPFGIITPLNVVAAPHAFGPVLVTRISLVEVELRFHEAQVNFKLKCDAAIQQVVDGSLTSEKSLLRLTTIDLMAAWEGSSNDLLGAFFQRYGSEPVRRLGRNASGDKWDEYLSKTPGYNNLVYTVQRLSLFNSSYNTQWHVIFVIVENFALFVLVNIRGVTFKI